MLFLLQSQAQNNELRESLAKIRSIATMSESLHVPDMSINLGRSQVSKIINNLIATMLNITVVL